LAASVLSVAALLGSPVRAEDDTTELRGQLEAQNELIRQQADALRQMGDRVRVLEDEQLAAKRSPVGGGPVSVDAMPQGADAGSVENTLGIGVPVAESPRGTLNWKFYTYIRYLNQRALDDEYENAFGETIPIDLRQDFQLQKVKLDTFGWVMDPKLTYLLYVWTANTSQGQGAQVVVAGFLQYKFHEAFVLGGGITSLPGTRTTSGNFPQWLGVDNRLIADEFFRPSYTNGIWAKGRLFEDFSYYVMLGNNLSTLGVDAGQIDAHLNTFSIQVGWEPLGPYGIGFGDYEQHENPVTRLALHFTRSDEDTQGQPDTDVFDNTQIRLSDGSVIFEPDLFAPGLQVRRVQYQMAALDAGVKYRGYSLEGEMYWRRLDDFHTRGGDLSFDRLDDYGFYLAASAMVLPDRLQLYLGGSKIFGEFGDPWDIRLGANFFPFADKTIRWNNEVMYLHDSPVGGIAYPYTVGGRGVVFHSNFEVAF
jgi:hypothetical protein